MGFYRVRQGHVLGMSGRTQVAGTVLELPADLAASVQAHVEACDAQGVALPRPTEFAALDARLATARVHERVSLAAAEVTRRRALLADAEARLAAEQTAATRTGN
jgi:predicted HicB family RNase H-like nuclease